jgi:hypothetical protein
MVGENAVDLYGLDTTALAAHVRRIGPTVDELSQPIGDLPDGMFRGNAFRTIGKWA